ncbi:uncharacterized protein [Ptychodera flava]|uniref:uncharacterized protein n=1 Tax=Ptychodera flava TaxID=63121 RepID=UPI00396A3D60
MAARTLLLRHSLCSSLYKTSKPRGRKAGRKHPKPVYRISTIVTTDRTSRLLQKSVRTSVLQQICVQDIVYGEPKAIETLVTNRTIQPGAKKRKPVLLKIPKFSTCFQKLQLNAALWNARSMTGKIGVIASTLIEDNLDILVITETWLKSQTDPVIADFHSAVSGYNVHHQSRSSRRGGGVAVIARSNLRVTEKHSGSFNSFESLDIKLQSLSQTVRIITIYRPPESKKNSSTTNDFLTEFSTLLESAVPSPGYLVIADDFNFHLDDGNLPDTVKFTTLLHSMGLRQHILSPTHNKGHILDLVIIRSADQILHSVNITNSMNSDHSLVRFGLTVQRPANSKVRISRRNFRNMSTDDLRDEIAAKFYTYPRDIDIERLSKFYIDSVTDILDTLAPIKQKVVTDKVRAPWYCEELLLLRKTVRRLETKYRATNLEIDRQIFLTRRNEYFRRCDDLKADYHRTRIEEADSKRLFKIIAELTDAKAIHAKELPWQIPSKENSI